MPDLSTYDWAVLSPANKPHARQGHAMIWDGARVHLFGGSYFDPFVGGVLLDDHWVYESDDWTQIFPGTVPSARAYHRMVWDGSRILLFGGGSAGTPFLGDLWEYTNGGGTWNQLSAGGGLGEPDGRFWHDMVWDGSRVIMYGGISGFGPAENNEIWELVVNAWNQLSPTNVPPNVPPLVAAAGRHGHKMSWNGSGVVMFGGISHNNAYPSNPYAEPGGATWLYESADWSQPGPATEPGARYFHAMTVTDDDGKSILFSGDVSPVGSLGEIVDPSTWVYDNTTWMDMGEAVNPGARLNADMVWAGDRAILFGGEFYSSPTVHEPVDDTWEYAGPPIVVPTVASIRHTFGLG